MTFQEENRMIRKAVFGLLLALSAPLAAQEFPNRQVGIVVPFPAGSISDIIARIAAERMAKSLGQPVVVENKPGLNGAVGAAQVTRAAPDGYTLLLGTNGIMFINPLLFKSLPYDPKDLAPLALAAEVPAVLIARNGLEAKNLREVIALAKAKPGAVSIASGQATAQVATEALRESAGIQLNGIPYKGEPPGLTDVAGGRVDLMVLNLPIAFPQMKAGTVRAIALVGAAKVPSMQEIPLASETLPGFALPNGWTGFFAPAGTPAAIRARLAKDVIAALEAPEARQRIEASVGTLFSLENPEQLAARIQRESAAWAKLIKAAKVDLQ
jgi:tripartite-type tricarboxylate transporter receptor subunit TctC